jgi:hypothetical protein
VLCRLSDPREYQEDPRAAQHVAQTLNRFLALEGLKMTYNDGPAESWLLVPPGEADATDGRMDATAPYGRALYGRQVGDRVELDGPDSHHELEVLAIEVD